MKRPIKPGTSVKIKSEAIYQASQTPLNGKSGTVHKDNGDNDIIVNIPNMGLIPFAVQEIQVIIDSNDLDHETWEDSENAAQPEELILLDAKLRDQGFSDLVRGQVQHADSIEDAISYLEFDRDELNRALEFINDNT